MSTTLTNGLKLPDKGSVDWYADMQNNYAILDGAVGTVAEHTTALAGKAPLVHTHTKSDITDLLNSNFIPSANNSYDLGSSSYQWNNLYAKNYYYNGTAWGLDKANEWAADQTIASNRFLRVYGYRFQVKNAGMELGTIPSSSQWTGMQFVDKNNTAISEIVQSFQSNGNSSYQINIWPNEANSEKKSVIAYTYNFANNVNTLQVSSNLLPTDNNTYNLGSSTQKWKTLNGTNPGALSLLDYADPDPIDCRQWDVTGVYNANLYTPTEDGWLNVVIKDTATSSICIYAGSLNNTNRYFSSVFGNGSQGAGRLGLMIPVRAGVQYAVIIKADAVADIYYARFFPCLGNV